MGPQKGAVQAERVWCVGGGEKRGGAGEAAGWVHLGESRTRNKKRKKCTSSS